MASNSIDTTVGCALLAGAVLAIVILVIFSRRRIERIDRRGGGSAREILRDLDRE